MSFYINDIDIKGLISKEWLTDVLKSNKKLGIDLITDIKINGIKERNVSLISFVDAFCKMLTGEQVLLKMVLKVYKHSALNKVCGESEIEFYRTVPPKMPANTFEHIYAFGYDERINSCFFVMKDLSNTHYSRIFSSQEYTKENLKLFVSETARFHTYWWDNPLLGNGVGKFISQNQFNEYITNNLYEKYKYFYSCAKDDVSKERFMVYEKIIESSDILFKRLDSKKNLTIVHGDLHLGNALFPYDESDKKLYLLDWDLWEINFGMKDIGYAISLNFYRHKRKEFETDLLKLYHQEIIESGINTYSWDDLLYDFKLSLILNMLAPVILCNENDTINVWWAWYIKSFMAFEDHKCMEFIG